MHPDHIGLADWLCERWSTPSHTARPPEGGAAPLGGSREAAGGPDAQDCRLWISATDWNAARTASQQTTGYGGEAAAVFFGSHGMVDPERQAKVRARGNYYASMVPSVPRQFRRLLDGQTVTIGGHTWHCHVGHGHAPEHISLHAPALGVLISGDMVLPRISTNVSVIDLEPEADPLPLYLGSLDRMRPLPVDTLVLPSHGKPFRGLHARVDQLHAHHAERLAEVLAACAAAPCSATDILPVLFKRALDLHQTTFAMGEAVAHLHALWHAGRLQRRRDAEGIWRFSAT
jgi:glyoxylase-like metal-dependent hydrolase (beta-lactamase superfamily II)